MNTTVIFYIALTIAAAPFARAAEPTTAEAAGRQNLLLQHPRPEYPEEAKRKRISGAGVFQVKFDYDTGHLREVHIVRSTGQPALDQACITALKQWQAKPHSLHTITVPMAFAHT